MAREIERKFLLETAPEAIAGDPGEAIEQGYLAVQEGSREVRVRRRGSRPVLTVKLGAGRSREEVELDLTDSQFDALWPLTAGMRVHKTRHKVPHEGLTIEIDVYGDSLDGLVTAEVEFATEDVCERFAPPDWLGSEVTGDQRFANESLALHGRPGPP